MIIEKYSSILFFLLIILSCERDSEESIDIQGCIDETACNYDSSATIDDGSCIFADQYCNSDSDCGWGNTSCEFYDTTVDVNLPFSFSFYGVQYTFRLGRLIHEPGYGHMAVQGVRAWARSVGGSDHQAFVRMVGRL